MKLFEVDDETIDDALVDRSPDIEVELIGVKWRVTNYQVT